MNRPLALGALAPLLLVTALATAPAAQIGAVNDINQQGTSYYQFVEEGAPSVEIYVFGAGTRNGWYRLQRGVSLTQALALAGGTAQTDSTRGAISTAFVRVLRTQGATRRVIYEATAERYLREPEIHPALETGDVIETQVTYEEVREPFTFRDGIEVAARLASLVSLVLLLTGLR